MSQKVKKLVAVLANFISMTNKKIEDKLERVSCIQYFKIFKEQIKVPINSKNKVHTISQTFAYQLDLKTQKINVKVEKINDTTWETYGIVISTFFILDKDGKERFFEKSFLLPHIKLDVVLGMPFFTMSNANIDFQAWNL